MIHMPAKQNKGHFLNMHDHHLPMKPIKTAQIANIGRDDCIGKGLARKSRKISTLQASFSNWTTACT
jgi:hypothetical protein